MFTCATVDLFSSIMALSMSRLICWQHVLLAYMSDLLRSGHLLFFCKSFQCVQDGNIAAGMKREPEPDPKSHRRTNEVGEFELWMKIARFRKDVTTTRVCHSCWTVSLVILQAPLSELLREECPESHRHRWFPCSRVHQSVL